MTQRRRAAGTRLVTVTATTLVVATLALLLFNQAHTVAGERHVTASDGHMCMFRAGDILVCYGSAATTTGKFYPPANVTFHAVTAGNNFACGLAVNGSLLCWGALPGGTGPPADLFFVDAHAGPRHVCGLVPNGTVLCYGNATSRGAIDVPLEVTGNFQGVSAGTDYTCGVARNHSVVCWGDVDNPVMTNTSVPVWQAITDAEHVATGADHACYVRVNGSVACWGSDSRGAASPPTELLTNGSVWWLAAGADMTCAMSGPSVPGPVICWGAVNGTIADAGYEVACAGWGCVASTTNATGDGSGQVVIAQAVGGLPLPPSVAGGDRAVVITLAGSGTAGYADGVGGAARFRNPAGVSLDGAGGLYVADHYNFVIRWVDISSRAVTTVAGVVGISGRAVGATPLQSTFNKPIGVQVDGAGNVYVVDHLNHAIRMLSGEWVAGSMSGAYGATNAPVGMSATFYFPSAVRADMAGGLLYVADYSNSQIRTIAIDGSHAVATLATLPPFVNDIALNPAAGVMYAAVGHSVDVVTYAGVSTLLAGSATSTGYADDTGSAARFNYITGLVLDASASVLYAVDYNNRIRRITTSGGVVTTIAGSGDYAFVDGIGTTAAFNMPVGIALDAVSSTLYIGDMYNHAIRLVQLPFPAPIALVPAPLPPSPLEPTHQLAAWRALGTANSSSNDPWPVLDARNATLTTLAPANTAGLNPAIRTLLLGNVTLEPRNETLAAAGNTNTTFSTSAQRGLQSLSLATLAMPVASLALPALTNLILAAPVPEQQVQLAAGSFDGLSTLTCINCAGAFGLANLSGLLFGNLLTQPLVLPLITALDASATRITAVYEHDFDGLPALLWLSVADNDLTYVSDTAFSATKQPALAIVDQSRTLLVTGGGCPATMYLRTYNLAASGNPYYACTACPAGSFCVGGAGLPVPCGTNTFAIGGAAACVPCLAGTYATGAARGCVACLPGIVAPGCNATASWRDVITLVADGAGSWIDANIVLVPIDALNTTANVSCSPVVVVSTTTVSCALLFLLPATDAIPVLTTVWVAHNGTGGDPHPLNASVTLLPSSFVALAPGGSDGLSPLTAGGGRIVLRLTASDWTASGLQPPTEATFDSLSVWMAGAPCTQPVWESSTTLSCAIPPADGVDIPVIVLLAGLFNVSGVLPSVFTPPALAAAPTDVALLPPAGSATSSMNITLSGTALCAGQHARLTVAYVGGLPCRKVQCIAGRTDMALCIGWNVTAAGAAGLLQYGNPSNLLNATAVWANRAAPLISCDACVSLATRPVLTSITPTSIAAPGMPVVVAGTGLMDAIRTPPTVFIGGEVCSGVQVLHTQFVQCNAPSVLASAPGYPVVSVVVINAAGAASTELVNLTYPTTFAVSWAATPMLTALPGSILTPPPTLRVLSRQAASCSLIINMISCVTSNPALASRPAGLTVAAPAASLAVGASGTPDAVYTDLYLDALEASGASGCTGTLTATCVDAVGMTASTAGQSNPTVVLAAWHADWNASSMPTAPFLVVPEALPELPAVFSLGGSGGGVLTASRVASLSCLALLIPAAVTPPPLNISLDRVPPRDVLSSVSGAVALVDDTAADIAFADLTASAAWLGEALALYAECTWVHTGERVRLPPLSLEVANASLALMSAESLLVEAYESAGVAAVATLSPPDVATFAGADAQCTWRTIAATSPSIVLAATSSVASWTLDADGVVVGGPEPLALTVEGPPGATLTLQLVCSLWGGNTLVSPPLNVTTHAYTVTLREDANDSAVVHTLWPSGTSMVLPWAPTLEVTAPARNVLTCSVSVASAALPPATAPAPGVGLGLSDATLALVGETSVSVSLDANATHANVSLPGVGLRAPGGTNASLVWTCHDGVGRSAALDMPIDVSVAALAAAWADAAVVDMPSVVVPGQALPPLTLMLASTPAVPLPPDVDAASLLSCVAGVFRASTPLPLSTPLATLIASASSFASVNTLTSVTTGADNASIVVTLPPLSTSTCPLDTQLTVAAECTWAPTGERVRLPTLATSTLQVTLGWATPPAIMLAYTLLPLHLAATVATPAPDSSGATTTATCEVLLLNATIRSTRLVAEPWSFVVDGSTSGGTSIPTSVDVMLQAPPATQLYVQASCTVWGQVLAPPPLHLTTASLEVRILSALPSTFIASDASSPWPLEPPLVVGVVTRHDAAVVAEVSCSVTSSTPATSLVVADATSTLTSLASMPTDPQTGVIAVPRFVVQTSPATRNVTLVVACQHLSSGVALAPLSLTIPATLLTVQQCMAPATAAAVGVPLPAFSVGVAVTTPNGTRTSPCTGDALMHQTVPLPSIVCTISLNAAASSINDTSSVFLQHAAVALAADSHVAVFDAFTLMVPQGQTYGLLLSCAVGRLTILPTLPFTVTLAGCSVGQESQGVACVTCGGNTFSLGGFGARCTGCPPAGAVCDGGILTLLPHYFLPAAQDGQQLGPDTELYPCYNSEACTLEYSSSWNGSDDAIFATYGCAYGYSGPLCGVCDAGVNYARFGDVCDTCWNPGVSGFFLVVVLIIVLVVLARVALREYSDSEFDGSDAAVIFRIMVGFLQAVGSLLMFRAGSTKAYDSVMGWTEVVSESPLNAGALQCILRMSFLAQYVVTILLPVAASAAVVVIFYAVTTGRAFCCGIDRASGWATNRFMSTLLFVLLLVYMPIVSMSLRALDCIDPVAGVRYLRADLSVECGVGQHAAARGMAYTVLVVLGIGFPAGLVRLGMSSDDQLVDRTFHANWGIVFDGCYRGPTRSSRPLRPNYLAPERPEPTWVVSAGMRVWWEAVVLCRKAGVALLAVLGTNPYLQCIGAGLWVVGALQLQLRYTPYSKPPFHRLETASPVATLLTPLISTPLLQYNVGVPYAELHAPGAMTGIEWTVTVLLTMMNLGTFVVLAGIWLHACVAPRSFEKYWNTAAVNTPAASH